MNKLDASWVRRLREARTLSAAERHGRCLLEGPRLIAAAVQAGTERVRVIQVAVTDAGEASHADLLARLTSTGVLVGRMTERDLERAADTRSPQGILAEAVVTEPASDAFPTVPRTLILDGLQDPGNVGTLVRGAAALGWQAVIALDGCADLLHPKTLRASAGGLFEIAWRQGVTVQACAAWLRKAALPLLCAQADGQSWRDLAWPDRFALVIGHETAGVSQTLQALPQSRAIAIPQNPRVDSLNAAMAGSILMAVAPLIA